MKEKQKKVSFISAVSLRYGICPTISGACVILALVYVFLNVDLFAAIQASSYSEILLTIFIAAVGLIGGVILAWMAVNSFRKRVGLPDAIAIMFILVGIGSIALKYIKDGIDFSNLGYEYFLFLGVAVIGAIFLIIHSITYRFENDQYCSYRQFDANSNLKKYYKELFSNFKVLGNALLALLCVAGIFVADANPQVPALATTQQGKIIIFIISGIAVGGYIVGIILRIINKRVNIVDVGIFMLLIASIFATGISIYRFINNLQDLVRLIISIAALAFSIISSLILIRSTYIPIPLEEKKANESIIENTEETPISQPIIEEVEQEGEEEESEAQEEQENKEEPAEAEPVSIEEDTEMAEQLKDIIEKLANQNKINEASFERLGNIEKSLQMIANALSGLMSDVVPEGSKSINIAMTEPVEEVVEVPVEEVNTGAEDYFDQVQEEQQVEEANAQIAETYAEEDQENDFLKTADDNVRIKPKMSFEMKLRVADDNIKTFYSDIKNELLSYGVHDRISRHRENFNQGRINIARLVINGKTLKVYLAVDPTSIDARYFHQEDVGHRKGLVDLPTMINVRSKVSARKVKELIGLIMESLVISKKPYEPKDFAKDLTLDGFTTIEAKGFGHLVKKTMTLEESESYPDAFAQQLVEVVEDEEYHEKHIKTELTIDDIVKNFNSGDVVDIASVRAKKLGPVNSNYLSIKESSSLTGIYKVYAHEFTPNAVKEICLSGGEAYLVVQPEKTVEEA